MVYWHSSLIACARLVVQRLIVLLSKMINNLTVDWLLCALFFKSNCKWWLVIVVSPHMLLCRKQEILRLFSQFNLSDVTLRLVDLLLGCLGIVFMYFCQLIWSPRALNFSWVIGLDMLCCARVIVTPIT
jgi:hypothetical protein